MTASAYEYIYVNMPRFGLATAGRHAPVHTSERLLLWTQAGAISFMHAVLFSISELPTRTGPSSARASGQQPTSGLVRKGVEHLRMLVAISVAIAFSLGHPPAD